jgi:hypothetical protein
MINVQWSIFWNPAFLNLNLKNVKMLRLTSYFVGLRSYRNIVPRKNIPEPCIAWRKYWNFSKKYNFTDDRQVFMQNRSISTGSFVFYLRLTVQTDRVTDAGLADVRTLTVQKSANFKPPYLRCLWTDVDAVCSTTLSDPSLICVPNGILKSLTVTKIFGAKWVGVKFSEIL